MRVSVVCGAVTGVYHLSSGTIAVHHVQGGKVRSPLLRLPHVMPMQLGRNHMDVQQVPAHCGPQSHHNHFTAAAFEQHAGLESPGAHGLERISVAAADATAQPALLSLGAWLRVHSRAGPTDTGLLLQAAGCNPFCLC